LVPKFGEGNKYEGTDVIEVPLEEIGEVNDDEAYLDSFWNEEYMEPKVGKWRRYEQNKGQAFFEAEMRD